MHVCLNVTADVTVNSKGKARDVAAVDEFRCNGEVKHLYLTA